jgi:hypothetical protein
MSTPGARSFAEWKALLERIEHTLQHSFPAPPEPPEVGGGGPDAVLAPLHALDERLGRWQACLDQAEGSAREADALLAGELRALEDWGRTHEAVKGRLATVDAAG